MASTCSGCLSTIDEGDSFCQSCGRPAGSDGAAAPVAVAAPLDASPLDWATGGGLVTAPALPSMAATGEAGPNSTYIGMRLRYDTQPEPSFDPLGNSRFIAQVALRALLYWWVWGLGFTLGIVFFLFALVAAGPRTAITLFAVAGVIVGIALLLTFWLLKVPIQLSEWKFSVDRQGAAAPQVFNHIGAVLRERRTPLDSLQVQRLSLPGERGVRDYLELKSTIFYGYVACFPYGDDLYVGWTFWVRISPFRYVLMFIARIWQSIFGKGNDLYASLRFDTARAMRETMHSAVREGIDIATTL
jgi:hypothetical protein